MTEYELLAAMNHIGARDLEGAQEKLGYLTGQAPPRASRSAYPGRRLLSLAAAVLVMTTVLFLTAFAVSEDFREYVISFFRVEETEQVPARREEEQTESFGVAREDVSIGGVITGTYVHTPQASHARGGIYLICTDDEMMNSGNHYDAYILENGEFIKLEKKRFSQDYVIQGAPIHIEFEWAEHGGKVALTYIDPEAPCRIYGLSGSAEGVLMELSIPHSYPVTLNLHTGEMTDLLAGTEAERFQNIGQAALTEDRSKLLLATWEEKLYCVDLAKKKLYDLDIMSGEHVEQCVVFDDTVTCMVLEGEGMAAGDLGHYRAWNIDLKTGERKELFSIAATPATSFEVWSEHQEDFQFDENGDLIPQEESRWDLAGLHFITGFDRSSHWGNMYAGSAFAVVVDEQRNVSVIDLETGEQGQIPGWQWPDIPYPILECQPSPDGKKLLLYSRASANVHETVGVLDFEKKTYLEFDRENTTGFRENLIYWFDQDSIMISADSGGMTRDYYLYELAQETERGATNGR